MPDVMALSLDDRIFAAFQDGAKSVEVSVLISDVESALGASGEAAEQARALALDPTLSAADVAAARREMEDAAFKRDRLQAAGQRLAERVRELRWQEEQARRLAAYEHAMAQRDQLAAELAAIYPSMAAKLVDLITRVDANDREIERINNLALPDGVKRLDVAEVVARSLPGFGGGNIPRICRDLRLPAFEYSRYDPYAWPRPG